MIEIRRSSVDADIENDAIPNNFRAFFHVDRPGVYQKIARIVDELLPHGAEL
jgi:hypothetical protein